MKEHSLPDDSQIPAEPQLALKSLVATFAELPGVSQAIIVPTNSLINSQSKVESAPSGYSEVGKILNPVEWVRDNTSKSSAILSAEYIIRQIKDFHRELLSSDGTSQEFKRIRHTDGQLILLAVTHADARLMYAAIYQPKDVPEISVDHILSIATEVAAIFHSRLFENTFRDYTLHTTGGQPDQTTEFPSAPGFLFREHDLVYALINFDGAFIVTNAPAKHLFGLPARESFQTRLIFEDQARFLEVLDVLRNGEHSASVEMGIIGPNNEIENYRFSFHQSQPAGYIHVLGTNLTSLRQLSERASKQDRTIDALFKVSSAVGAGRSPAEIAEEGIRVLCEVTSAVGGVCYLNKNSRKEFKSDEVDPPVSLPDLKLLSVYGLSSKHRDKYFKNPAPEIFSWVSNSNEPLILPKIKPDNAKNWWMIPVDSSTGGTCIIVPLELAGEILGILILFYGSEKIIDSYHLQLMRTAASQIGLAARQAELVLESLAQTRAVNARYRISHELSAFLSMEEVFQKAFQILHEELGIERYWLGLVNETCTRVIGQAAYGSGWKRKLIEIRVDISREGHPMSDVIRSRKPAIIKNVEKGLPGLGLRRFILRTGIDSVALIPLVAGGQVLGVLALEGERDGVNLSKEDLALLSSLGAEIANVLLTKRLEERVQAGETMRAAGLLAAGIAHNFNNVLQGIMGQASLLELYAERPEQVRKSAGVVQEAATKGAALVKQLLSFAHLEDPLPDISDIKSLIETNSTNLQRLLKERQYIQYQMQENLPAAFVDPRQVLRILQALLMNAAEAMHGSGRVEILLDTVVIDNDSPHFEVPFGDYLRISVRDDGIGMDEETRRRCFEPFFSTKNLDPGSGLSLKGEGMGLAAAYALARKNGGRLVVDSRKGHGSLFTLYLPVYKESGGLAVDDEAKGNRESDLGSQLEIEDASSDVKSSSEVSYAEPIMSQGIEREPGSSANAPKKN